MRFIRFITFLHKSSLIHTELTSLMLSRAHKRLRKKRQPDFIALQTKPKETKIPLLHLSTAKSQLCAHFCCFPFVARSQRNEGEKTTTNGWHTHTHPQSDMSAYAAPETKTWFIHLSFLLRHFMYWRWKHQNSKKYYHFIDFQLCVSFFSFGPIISNVSHLSLLRKSDCTSEKWRARIVKIDAYPICSRKCCEYTIQLEMCKMERRFFYVLCECVCAFVYRLIWKFNGFVRSD